MSQLSPEHLRPSDRYVTRNRNGRRNVFLFYISFVCGGLFLAGWKIASDWFGYPEIGLTVAAVVIVLLLSTTLWRFFIRVGIAHAFVTIDELATFLQGRTDEPPTPEEFQNETEEERIEDRKVFPTYLAGLHLAYPWERRDADYNFSLKEVSQEVVFDVLVQDGVVTLDGSYRIRPDFKNLIPFLSGVATSAEEIRELIIARGFAMLQKDTVDTAQEKLEEVNKRLYAYFGIASDDQPNVQASKEVSDFEKRFGLFVGDVTIGQILPTKEVQRTRSGIAEAAAVAKGTAILLGYPNTDVMEAARSRKEITNDQISRARDRFLSISGNLEGMELKRYEIDLSGLDPETVKALAPIAAMYAASRDNGKNGGK